MSGKTEVTAKNRTRRWKLLVAVFTTSLAMLAFLLGAATFTSTPSFCSTCHEMKPQHITFKYSAHNQIQCIECHGQPGLKNTLKNKADLLHMVYQHFSEPQTSIISSAGVPDKNCEQCHSRNRLVTATGDIIVNHEGHIEKEIPCITCHSGVVHAKIAERGISHFSGSAAWNEENAPKLMGDKFEKPNMGTCIDCHVQVNQGERPWVDAAYSLPAPEKEVVKEEWSSYFETPEMKAGTLDRDIPEAQQKLVLEAVGQQHADVKLSMICSTCHRKIKIPNNHDQKNWTQSHGDVAVKELSKCLACHKDSLWIKQVEKQNLIALLTEPKEEVSPSGDLLTASKESRNNLFCSSCHAYFPASHQDRYTWLTDTHRHNAVSPDERKKCFVCHDNAKPLQQNRDSNAPSDVYCEFCHEGDFVGEGVS